jgi:hypothetical protein
VRAVALLLAVWLGGCAYSPELTVLLGPKRIEDDTQNLGFTMALIQRFGDHGACGYAHGSDPEHGPPFNDESEFTFDSAGCGGRWGGKRK